MVPVIAGAFAAMGYRRATSAELARCCGVRENILYRLWPDKKAMFIAAIDFVYEQAEATWANLLAQTKGPAGAARLLLKHESEHYGESGLHRIILAGIGEADDPEIGAALRRMYGRFHRFIRQRIAAHRGDAPLAPDASLSAWGIIGLGVLADIGHELRILTKRDRRCLFVEVGGILLEGKPDNRGSRRTI
jgi:AcrR family transcriptional regulator